MNRYVVPLMGLLLCQCGCAAQRTVEPEPAASIGVVVPDSGVDNRGLVSLELVVDKAKAERLGFTFARMESCFAPLKLSKHVHSTRYTGESFVLGLHGPSAELKRALASSVTTDSGAKVRVQDLCTVHLSGEESK